MVDEVVGGVVVDCGSRFSDNLDQDRSDRLIAEFFVENREAREWFERSWCERGSRFRRFFVRDDGELSVDAWLASKEMSVDDFVRTLAAQSEWVLIEKMGLLSHRVVIEDESYDRDPAPLRRW